MRTLSYEYHTTEYDTFWINNIAFFNDYNEWNYNLYKTDLIEILKYE